MTCKTLGIDPFAYLRDVLTRLPLLIAEVKDFIELRQHPTLDELLPGSWRTLRGQIAASTPES